MDDQVFVNQQVDRLMEINKESMEKFIEKNKGILTLLENWFAQTTEEMDLVALNHFKYFFGHFFTDAVILIQNEFAARQRRPS